MAPCAAGGYRQWQDMFRIIPDFGQGNADESTTGSALFRSRAGTAISTRSWTRSRSLLADRVELLEPVPLGGTAAGGRRGRLPAVPGRGVPASVEAFQAIDLPILIVTSEFGTLSMWDWEIIEYLQVARASRRSPPTTSSRRKKVCAALRRQAGADRTRSSWSTRTTRAKAFRPPSSSASTGGKTSAPSGSATSSASTIVKKSFRELGAAGQGDLRRRGRRGLEGPERADRGPLGTALRSAVKLYLAVKRDLDQDPSIRGAASTASTSRTSPTPRPAWPGTCCIEERGLIWGCEADTMSMLTKYLLHRSLGAPIMMTNLYPFLLGDAAAQARADRGLSRGRGRAGEPHPGGPLRLHGRDPASFATEWTLRKKVLAIVDDNATAIDARLPTGDVTLAKLHPDDGQDDRGRGRR